MRKTIFTLNVDNYAPEITKITYPYFQKYANKIGADLWIISERKYQNFPPVYEKLQIYDLAKELNSDWNIYIDSDALIHPDFFDITDHLPINTVAHNGCDMAGNRWRYDDYLRRDGRHIGSCNWFTVASSLCLDLWHPLEDLTLDEALENIFPIKFELNTVIKAPHLIDDYVLSRNIARYGLKFTTVSNILKSLNDQGNYLWHQYTLSIEEKVKKLTEIRDTWENDGIKKEEPVKV